MGLARFSSPLTDKFMYLVFHPYTQGSYTFSRKGSRRLTQEILTFTLPVVVIFLDGNNR
jgi:hypothetical protein